MQRVIPAKLRALSVAPGSWRGRRFPLPANCFPGHSGQRRRGPAATWGGGSEGRQGGGSCTGPWGRALSCARPGKRPGSGAAADQNEARKWKEGKSGLGKGKGKGREREEKAGTSSFPTARSRKDGERREPKHPLPLARAPSLLRSRTSQPVATETPPRPEGRDLRAARRIDVLGELPLASCQWRFSCGQVVAKGLQRGISDFSQLILWHAEVRMICLAAEPILNL